MSNKNKVLEKYCSGCGLCNHAVEGGKDQRGFYRPSSVNKLSDQFDTSVCYPMQLPGLVKPYTKKSNIWGEFKEVYLGYSSDSQIRKKASSGGILTALCCYLLNTNKVDGIIHVRADETDPTCTKAVISRRAEEVIANCGSRYTASAPLLGITEYLNSDETYVFVGKPCDVTCLRKYIRQNKITNIKYLFSFFCAGTPSSQANNELVRQLGVKRECLKSLNYRGNGWPGYATAEDREGSSGQMSYEKSWGGILGRDLQEICRFCWDGVGEAADISCGDAWYLKDGNPDFSEHDGRNVIFTRTKKGEALLKKVVGNGYIEVEKSSDLLESLALMQQFQASRKAMLYSRVLAMKLFRKNSPAYSLKALKTYARTLPFKTNLRSFLGTVKRIVKNKM